MERVVIVGGGVLGLMHAVQARRRGLAVVHLEREADARGASVRNFGLIWVSGRGARTELALALRARALWEELAAAVPEGPGSGRTAGSPWPPTTPSWACSRRPRPGPTRPSAATSCSTRRRSAR